MEHIIQQIALDLAKKITERAFSDKNFNLDTMSSMALSDCKEAARQIIEVIIEDANVAIREDKVSRCEKGILMKEHDRSRDVLTELGRIKYKRDYYYDKNKRIYFSPIDLVLGVESRERISKGVSAKLVSMATDYSYQRSAMIVTEGAVSRQSVRNMIQKAPNLEVIPEEKKKTVKEIHVFADEDHVHMQKPEKAKGKKSKQVPLVTVTEGVREESTSRKRTINPIHFVDANFNTTALWENVEAYLRLQYDLEKTEKIYVHGDGANWIEAGLKDIDQTEHVMDGYHLGKYLRAINAKFPKRNVRSRLEKAIRENNLKSAQETIENLKPLAKEPKQIEILAATEIYINNKWEELVKRRVLEIPGSCTEGQVSHVLSERFSRNPMGWSRETLGKLTRLRVYVKNGGKIESKHFERGKTQDCSCYEELIQREVGGSYDWSIFDREPLTADQNSGTQNLIKMLSGTNIWILN